MKPVTPRIRALFESLSDLLFNQQDGEKSDVQLRQALHDAIRADEPGFYDIDAVFPESNEVVYLTMPEDKIIWYRRTFTLEDDGTAVLNDDRVEVEMVTRYEPVAAAADDEAVTVSGVDGMTIEHPDGTTQKITVTEESVAVAAASCPCNHTEGEPTMNEQMRKLIEGLIACEHSPFTEEDSEKLAGFSEAHLAAMAESFAEVEEPEPTPEPKPETVVEDDEDPKEKTDEEWLAEAPESLRRLVNRSVLEEDQRRTRLVGAIAKATNAYSEDVLKEKTTEDLEALAGALKLDQPTPDFSAQLVESPQATDIVPSPKPYTLALEAKRNAN